MSFSAAMQGGLMGPSGAQPTSVANQSAAAYNGAVGATGGVLNRLMQPSGYQAQTTGAPIITGNYGYNPAAANASTSGVSTVGGAAQAVGSGYQAATAAPTSIGNIGMASMDNLGGPLEASTYRAALQADPNAIHQLMGNYYNPYTEQVVGTTLDQLERDRQIAMNQVAADAGAAGSFGNSRFAIREAETDEAMARIKAQTTAGLYDQMFNTAAGLAGTDVGNQITVNTANQNATNTARQFNASETNRLAALDRELAGQFEGQNAAAQTQRALTQGQLDQNQSFFNAGAMNDAGQFNAGLMADLSQFNAGQTNQLGMFDAGQRNQVGMFNAGQQNQIGQFNAGSVNDANRFGAGNALTRDTTNAGNILQTLTNNQNAVNRASEFNLTNELGRLQSAGSMAGQLGSLSQQGFNNARTIAGDQNAAADQQRQVIQQIMDAAAGQYSGYTGAGQQGLDGIVQAIGAYNPGSGSTNSSSPGIIPSLLSGASSIAGFF